MNRHLTRWHEFDTKIGDRSLEYRPPPTLEDINRFAAKFRAATSDVEITGYRDITTAKGYSALLKIVLVWAAYEQFLKLFNLKQNTTSELIEETAAREVQEHIRTLDTGGKFYNFIKDVVNQKHQEELKNYSQNNPCNIIYLASVIRHAFVHGALTPNVNTTQPQVVSDICSTLSDTLIEIMDKKFTKFYESLAEPN